MGRHFCQRWPEESPWISLDAGGRVPGEAEDGVEKSAENFRRQKQAIVQRALNFVTGYVPGKNVAYYHCSVVNLLSLQGHITLPGKGGIQCTPNQEK